MSHPPPPPPPPYQMEMKGHLSDGPSAPPGQGYGQNYGQVHGQGYAPGYNRGPPPQGQIQFQPPSQGSYGQFQQQSLYAGQQPPAIMLNNAKTEPQSPKTTSTTIQTQQGKDDSCARTCFALICAFICPPLGVCIYLKDCCGTHVCLSVLLTLLGYVPGLIHFFCIMCGMISTGPKYVVTNIQVQT